MKKINNLIGLSGRICSGKSFLAKKLAKDYDIQIVSFGSYLFSYSTANELPTDRNSLQDLGEQLVKNDPENFVDNVLVHAGNINDVIIIEGIRHQVIYNILKDISSKAIFMYVDENVNLRYKRYIDRTKEIDDKVSFNEFLQIDNHIVEQEIESLRKLYDIFITSNDTNDELLEKVMRKFQKD
ncbi:AAA family ATPase [Flavobacterium sp. RHBU_24]|uniref:AAA family ATPase n=1 Tax=Flavobacterium sp. RHBU_24 TaxID=3391185 RepID=UPI00398529A7